MKPYPGKGLQELETIYNYRLSIARPVIENAFGILAAKWGILRRPIKSGIEHMEGIITAVICSHIYLKLTETEGILYLGTGEMW